MSQKNASRQITVAEMAPHIHSFGIGENKVNKIAKWLIEWIKHSLALGKIKHHDLLPQKGDLAFHIGVSKGTIQNVFRLVEDYGLVESKQKVGTFIKKIEYTQEMEKLTSKREIAVEKIKQYLIENNYKVGDYIVSGRKLSEVLGISNTTVRNAIGNLLLSGILTKENKVFKIQSLDFKTLSLKNATLVDKTTAKLKKYILKEFKNGDKLPSNNELAKKFQVSVKTVHDAVKQLTKEGLLASRRGQYGTMVVEANKEVSLYNYEKVELEIRHYISNNCKIGDKLPPIVDLANNFNVSPKTIKKALDNLSEDGYLTFTRGRYGGTFVTDIPQNINEAYKWLALSAEYVLNMEN